MAEILGKLRDSSNKNLYVMAETIFRDFAKQEAKWDDEQINSYFTKVEESQKPK